jgi:AcrR family transcriptional regulator
MTNGFAGTSMDDVAQAAGVSKKTLYRFVPNKADLFESSVTDRIARFMLAVDPAALDLLPVATALGRIVEEYGLLTLSPETVAIQKLVIAESDRFPDLATSFFTDAVVATQQVLAAYLKQQCERGTLQIEDPDVAAGMLRGMMAMEPQRAAMMKQRALPSHEEIADRARRCVQVFLFGTAARA